MIHLVTQSLKQRTVPSKYGQRDKNVRATTNIPVPVSFINVQYIKHKKEFNIFVT